MRVLVKIPEYMIDEFEDASGIDEIALNIYNHVAETYEGQTSSADGSCEGDPDFDSVAEECELVLGSESPEEIIAEAENWNRRVDDEFVEALKDAVGKVPKETYPDGTPMWHKTGTGDMYTLDLAARAINDQWRGQNDYAVCVPTSSGYEMSTLIDGETIADVKARPETYALITIFQDESKEGYY